MPQLNDAGLTLIQQSEGLCLDAYPDPAGVWTIGYGHTSQVQPGQHISAEQAELFLRQDLASAEETLQDHITSTLNDNQYSALVSFVYNIGAAAFLSSTMLGLLNRGDFQAAADQFPRWTHAGDQELPGLITRRQAERDLFLTPSRAAPPANLRLFAPPEQYTVFWTLQTDRERQLTAWVAGQLGLRYSEHLDQHKLFLGLPHPDTPLKLQPLLQSNALSCGQTSVAMAVNALTGKHLTDLDIQNRYGFSLLQALNQECPGYRWLDGGNLIPANWLQVERILQQSLPVILGLNGPPFSPSGRGHIITLIALHNDQLTYADPATGTLRTATVEQVLSATPHPDGKFIFYPQKGP